MFIEIISLLLTSSCFNDHFFFGSSSFISFYLAIILHLSSTGACDRDDADGGPAGGCIACKTCLKGQYQNGVAATACIKCAAGRYTDLREGKSESVCRKSFLYLKFKRIFLYNVIIYIITMKLTFLFLLLFVCILYFQKFVWMVHLPKIKVPEHVTCVQLDTIPKVKIAPITTIVSI